MFISGKREDGSTRGDGITAPEMRVIEKGMETYVARIFSLVEPEVNRAGASLPIIQLGYVKNRYYQYLLNEYTTPLMLQYVNAGEESMQELVASIVAHEKERVEKMRDVTRIGGDSDFDLVS